MNVTLGSRKCRRKVFENGVERKGAKVCFSKWGIADALPGSNAHDGKVARSLKGAGGFDNEKNKGKETYDPRQRG